MLKRLASPPSVGIPWNWACSACFPSVRHFNSWQCCRLQPTALYLFTPFRRLREQISNSSSFPFVSSDAIEIGLSCFFAPLQHHKSHTNGQCLKCSTVLQCSTLNEVVKVNNAQCLLPPLCSPHSLQQYFMNFKCV